MNSLARSNLPFNIFPFKIQKNVVILNLLRYCANVPEESVVMSPDHPSNYPHNLDQTWPVTVQAGKLVQLEFTQFNIEPDSDCSYDWIKVIKVLSKEL